MEILNYSFDGEGDAESIREREMDSWYQKLETS